MPMAKLDFARALRKNMTPAEEELWCYLRCRTLCFRFRRQAVILGWIADFWCPSRRLVIEVDGSVHRKPEQRARDERRDGVLMAHGIRTLRLPNEMVLHSPAATLQKIRSWL